MSDITIVPQDYIAIFRKTNTDEVREYRMPLVRCGHCKWWKCNPNTEAYGVCKKVSYDDFEVVMSNDDFCSYADEKEDGEV